MHTAASTDATGVRLSSSSAESNAPSTTGLHADATPSRPPLIDSFGRVHNYLRISLTERCNLRCVYCMPEQGIDLTANPQLLTTEETFRLVKLFASMGVKKVRLTGGEPLIRPNVIDIVQYIGAQEGIKQLAITTNGILLPRYIERLRKAGVTGLNISLDTLDPHKFEIITRRQGFSKVMDSIRLAEALQFDSVKVNCVVMRGVNDTELGQIAEMTKDRHLEVRFIEFMPFDDNKWDRKKMFSMMETMDAIEKHAGAKLKYVAKGETAQLFQLPGHKGKIGFIASMTTAFCSTCNRLRMTADGNLKVCLFGDHEWSLRDAMRSGATDDDLDALIRQALFAKHEVHGGNKSPEDIAAHANRPMIKIGG